jgi:hypothetical protein
MKKRDYRIAGVIIGGIIGVLVGFGAISQIKKSQREKTISITIIAGSILGISIGYKIGSKIDNEIWIENELGIDQAKSEFIKVGKGWVISTQWTDSKNNSYTLLTGQASNKTLISQLNDELFLNHNINSGSKVNVSKFHKIAQQQIYKKLKETYKIY